MAVINPFDREIQKKTYGKDLREPIHDALSILANDTGSYRPVMLMTQGEYDALSEKDQNVCYAIKRESW